MSDTDSFIDEVTEEVRRDRLFHMLRRYGWIGGVAVALIVGGTAVREYNRAQTEAAAQSLGDAMIAAMQSDQAGDRASALAEVTTDAPDGQMLVDMARAGALIETGDTAAAVAILEQIASNGEVTQIYRNIALFKSLVLQSDSLSIADRRLQFASLARPGAPLEHLAVEQLALLDIEEGNTQAAVEHLQSLIDGVSVNPDLRERATQLIVVLGGETAPRTVNGG